VGAVLAFEGHGGYQRFDEVQAAARLGFVIRCAGFRRTERGFRVEKALTLACRSVGWTLISTPSSTGRWALAGSACWTMFDADSMTSVVNVIWSMAWTNGASFQSASSVVDGFDGLGGREAPEAALRQDLSHC
jgi:hypothetical protein